jgi:hypothetical protein
VARHRVQLGELGVGERERPTGQPADERLEGRGTGRRRVRDTIDPCDGHLEVGVTVRMVTGTVTVSIDSVETTGMGFRATATTRIDRYAFGIVAAKGMAARYLTIELVAVAAPH